MVARKRAFVLAATGLMLLNSLAGLAAAGSHYSLSVVLWNDSAEGLTAGETFNVWAQVYDGDTPSNATSVTFRFGFGVITGPPFPATNYAGTYWGSPGLYRATVTLTAFDTGLGITGLAVFVGNGTDTANSFRYIVTAPIVLPPVPGGPWRLTAGVENQFALGRTINPGETISWRIDTYNNGVHADAGSLSLRLFAAPDVDFSETPTALTANPVSTGVYTANFTVPANLRESRQYVLKATISETNSAEVNASADVWFYDTVVAYSAHNGSVIAGELTVGDGVSVAPGLTVALALSEEGNPSHSIGSIAGTTDASGKLAFSVANDGTSVVEVRGWVNRTGGASQFIADNITMAADFVPASPDTGRLDAVPQTDFSMLPWSGVQTFDFQIVANGSIWAQLPVVVQASTARGPLFAANMTTDENGIVNVSVDLSARPEAVDDEFNNGFNVTFRVPVGTDASASDGLWWGEDLELVLPDNAEALLRLLLDANLDLLNEPVALGSEFGVAGRYPGPKNATGYEGGAFLTPGGPFLMLKGLTGAHDVWTGHGQPFVNPLLGGPVMEFFTSVLVPSYWPDTNYTLLVAVVPTISVLERDNPELLGVRHWYDLGIVNWMEFGVGGHTDDFVPSVDITKPIVFGPQDITINTSEVANFSNLAYDDSLDFHNGTQTTYNVYRNLAILDVIRGNPVSWSTTVPGDYDVRLVVEDSAANFVDYWFKVHVLDITPPTVEAGTNFAVLGGTLANFSGTARDDDVAFAVGPAPTWSFVYNGSTVTIPGTFSSPSVTANFTFWTLGVYTVTLNATDAAGHTSTDTVQVTVTSPDTEPPNLTVGTYGTVLAGQSATFSFGATDNDPNFPQGATCGWTFNYNGSSQSFNATSFTFTFWTLGNYDLTLFCVDFWGNFASDTVSIIVDRPDKEAPVVDGGADVAVLTNEGVSLHAVVTDNDVNFPAGAAAWWTFDEWGSARNLSGFDTSYTFGAAGVYTITLFVRDGWGNVGTDTKVVTVNVPDTSPPTIFSIADWTIAPGVTLGVRAEATDNDPNFASTGNISWSFTYGTQPVQQYGDLFSFLFADAGNYTITVRATDAAGNAAVRTFVVHVLIRDTTAPTITVSADHTAVYVGTRVNFTASASDGGAPITDGARFNWTFTYNGSLVTLHGLTASFVFNAPGSYVVTLTVADAAGNTGTEQLAVIVTQPPPVQPPNTTPASDLTLPLLIALLGAAAALGFIVMRRKRRSPLTEFRSPSSSQARAPPAEPRAEVEEEETDGGDEDKDLDDLLK